MHRVITAGTIQEPIEDEVTPFVDSHSSKSILVVFEDIADTSLKALHNGLHSLATVRNRWVESDSERLMNSPSFATQLMNSKNEVIQGAHGLVSQIASFLQLCLDLICELVKVAAIVVIEEDLARLNAMRQIRIVRTDVVSDLDHDVHSSVLNMRAATTTF
ncbi:hypothetical protein HG531_002327 [Fusarium graminearum]|nr:hypothetical protein HG531_002327 [Fusarium graminearum]